MARAQGYWWQENHCLDHQGQVGYGHNNEQANRRHNEQPNRRHLPGTPADRYSSRVSRPRQSEGFFNAPPGGREYIEHWSRVEHWSHPGYSTKRGRLPVIVEASSNFTELDLTESRVLFFYEEGSGEALKSTFYDPKAHLLELGRLKSPVHWHDLEIRMKDGMWVRLEEKLLEPEKWGLYSGKGTKEKPFKIRKQVVDTYKEKIRIFPCSPASMSHSDLMEAQGVPEEANIRRRSEEETSDEEKDRLWWNHRPYTAAALQASLAYPGFGRFQDHLQESPDVLTAQDYKDAGRLANAGQKLYKGIEQRKDAMNHVLSEILGIHLHGLTIEVATPAGNQLIDTEGSIRALPLKKNAPFTLNTQYANEGEEVYFHGQGFYRGMCAGNLENQLVRSSNVPCFEIDQPGPLFRVNAMWYQSHLQAEPLTPAHNLLSLERYNMRQIEQLALTLRALKLELPPLSDFLETAYEEGDTSIRDRFLEKDLPYPFYMKWDDEPNILLDVVDIVRPEGAGPEQRLWVGRLPNDKLVLIKFAMNYGKEVHEAWAEAGLAPKVYMCRRLPGGWYVVVTEWLNWSDNWFLMAKLDVQTRHAVTPFVEERLAAAHALEVDAEGRRGVLGDAQCQNVFVKFAKVGRNGPAAKEAVAVHFIDFDFAGAEGVKRYPPFMSNRIAWPDGAETGAPILQKHDRDLLHSQGLSAFEYAGR